MKKFKKDVVIASTIDPGNGDKGPHAISVVQSSYGLKKGQVVVCNFADSSGNAGKGTTAEVIDPKTGSTKTFVQSSKIEGCAGVATTLGNEVCAAGMSAKKVVCFDRHGHVLKAYGSPLVAPFDDADAHCVQGPSCLYNAEYIFASDANTGGIVDWSINNYGNPHEIQVASGFAVNKQSGWGALGPSGLSYDAKPDLLYIADGSTNTVVVFTNASTLLVKNEIVVLKGGKTFKCKYHGSQTPCGKLVYAGSPLNAPVAMTVLPNGNVIAANSAGGNTLVEISSAGKVLATKVVDTSTTQGVFALRAIGTNDGNTALYYTDTNDNSLHELEQ
ncbi:MAG: hypothetical protein JO146_07560 [Candidatus Eremiobacteraeota bacterium]|nr:hypothetical protein [Candidatus Eremiobacteraeota bacterium]